MSQPRFLDRILQVGLRQQGADAVAVYDDGSRIGFGELDRRADTVAARFLAAGCRKGDRVAVIADKSTAVVPFMLACWRIGCVYVPLDAGSPLDRLSYILDDVQPKALCTGTEVPALRALADTRYHCACFDMSAAVDVSEPAPALEDPGLTAQDAAYCIYTSGSTGFPKGVLISHGSCVAFFEAVQLMMGVGPESKCLSTGPLFFDISVVDLMFPLYQGASVYLYAGQVMPTRFGKVVQTHRITHFCAPSPILTLISKHQDLLALYDYGSLRIIMTGADLLDGTAVQNLLAKVPGLRVINGYGPTEATCVCTAFVIDASYQPRNGVYPIGQALAGMRVRVVDEADAEVPAGEQGELLVAGPQLLTCYWRNPEQTALKTVLLDGERYYRTGDVVRRDPEGELVFLGRADEEVKISGVRIHLNEIRNALMNTPGVRRAVVGTRASPNGKQIIAGVEAVQATGTAPAESHFIEVLSKTLPRYMLPSRVLVFSEFPSLPSGKLDTKAALGQAGALEPT
ncbi:MAG: amino acid adenylation domain-containing protein [Pseudomonadota bacterium]